MADKTKTKTETAGEAAGDNSTAGEGNGEAPPVYRVLDPGGLEWRDPVSGRPKFARQGARRSDIPKLSIPWLTGAGHIELVETGEAADPGEDEGGA